MRPEGPPEESRALGTPILLLVFNRPAQTARVFERIRAARPRQLFVSADGPRAHVATDRERCAETRAVLDGVDWPCEVVTNFRTANVGLRRAIPEAIAWFFERVDEGIILEDDCLPAASFFAFCEALLERYRDDDRVFMISGSNLVPGPVIGDGSYFFSRLAGIWGWATWRRTWGRFDPQMATFPAFREQEHMRNLFDSALTRRYWLTKLDIAHRGGNSWGFAWAYALLSQGALCACPRVNLVSNIGFGPDGVHATDPGDPLAGLPTAEISGIRHPLFVLPDGEADARLTRHLAHAQLPEAFWWKRLRMNARRGAGRLKRAVLQPLKRSLPAEASRR